ncbi:NADH:flavin oxidoreductase/NADH oxidase [Arthrobacter sp. TMT4-20]
METTSRTTVNTPLTLRGVTIPNRVWMSPMCQYSAKTDGVPTDWHLVHYGSRAVGGCGLVMVESTGIGPDHRTTAADLGLWSEDQVAAHTRLAGIIRSNGAIPAVQLQCAGRKSSHQVPWQGGGQNSPVSLDDGGWTPGAPSAVPFGGLTVPREMTVADIDVVVEAFAESARLADRAKYDVVEIHAAHGYLLHQFLSPLSNQRSDDYGGSLENRMRLALRVSKAVRDAFPEDKPVFVRMTATDWADGGITFEEAAVLASELAGLGIDLLDVSSGALVPTAPPPQRTGLNVDYAVQLAASSGLSVAPVGQIADAVAVKEALDAGVEAVLVGRALLRDPYFKLRIDDGDPKDRWPSQHHRALI